MARIARYCDRRCEEYPVNGEVFHFGFCKFTSRPRSSILDDYLPTHLGRCSICIGNGYTLRPDGAKRKCPCRLYS